MIREYFALTKPGIIYGNAITAAAGFLLAAHHLGIGINFYLFLEMLIGNSLVIASACVFNNYIDRGIDSTMERTRGRALVTGIISGKAALIFGTILGFLGFSILAFFTNIFSFLVSAIGYFFYIYMYSRWKRISVHGTLIGAVAGAAPPVVGYASAANTLDSGALILFLILLFWQMPHFYAIAIYRLEDYKKAGIPVLPAKKGMIEVKKQIFFYIVAFTAASAALYFFNYAGKFYIFTALSLGASWLTFAICGFWAKDEKRWARKMFIFSLFVLITIFAAIALAGT